MQSQNLRTEVPIYPGGGKRPCTLIPTLGATGAQASGCLTREGRSTEGQGFQKFPSLSSHARSRIAGRTQVLCPSDEGGHAPSNWGAPGIWLGPSSSSRASPCPAHSPEQQLNHQEAAAQLGPQVWEWDRSKQPSTLSSPCRVQRALDTQRQPGPLHAKPAQAARMSCNRDQERKRES